QTRLFDGVGQMLKRLADANIARALVTSNTESNVRAILGADNARLFQYYECGASLLGKASRYRRVLRKSGTRPSDAISIGDEIRDLEASQKEGISFGAVTWGYMVEEALHARSPTFVFHSLDEIAEQLTR